jgi:hypothetical protein
MSANIFCSSEFISADIAVGIEKGERGVAIGVVGGSDVRVDVGGIRVGVAVGEMGVRVVVGWLVGIVVGCNVGMSSKENGGVEVGVLVAMV